MHCDRAARRPHRPPSCGGSSSGPPSPWGPSSPGSSCRGALRSPRANPRSLGDDTFIGIGGVGIPALVLIAIGVVTVFATTLMRPPVAADDSLAIEIVGHQYWWEIRYPDLGVVTANEVTIPVDRPVELTLRSADVIHSFWVPELAGKQDLIPGQTNRLELRAERTGSYWGVCAEFCGIQHAGMGIVVHVLDDDEFDGWSAEREPIELSLSGQAARGREVFNAAPCGGCHRIAGTEAKGDVGPDLTHLATRETLGAGVLDNTPENLAHWITSVDEIKPGAKMQPFTFSDDDLDTLVAYLETPR